MVIAGRYSFNGGELAIQQKYPHLLKEVEGIIASVNAEECKTKESKEKTKSGGIVIK